MDRKKVEIQAIKKKKRMRKPMERKKRESEKDDGREERTSRNSHSFFSPIGSECMYTCRGWVFYRGFSDLFKMM
ncbi:hypothetical protein CSUI_005346 [Cystoisospora suis]|uniref:Uncharacterized protein n=1 Tax=Cystoisospora suis TaxID=483139 RepID=A0A2C6KXW4_9APIC|nr:hypothetical protein CSUI_005346 [Cystoisospora suis]